MEALRDLDNLLNVTLETANNLKLAKANPKEFAILTVKARCLANYNKNLLTIKAHQVEHPGESLQEDEKMAEVVFETTKDRTTLERIRNLELKVQPRVDNYMKILKEGKVDKSDPTFSRARLMDESSDEDNSDQDDDEEALDADSDNQEEDGENITSSDDEGETGKSKGQKSAETKPSGKYVPPKLVPTPYPFERPQKQDKAEAKLEKSRQKRLASRSALGELIEDIGDAPVERVERGANPLNKFKMSKTIRDMEQRRMEEEDQYKRFSISKKQKNKEEKAMTRDEFESITTMGGSVADLVNNERYQKFVECQKRGKKKGKGKQRGASLEDGLFKKKRRR